ncbi:hypothetical protein KIL84_001610, partial [Mauremys mutica]
GRIGSSCWELQSLLSWFWLWCFICWERKLHLCQGIKGNESSVTPAMLVKMIFTVRTFGEYWG